MKSITSFVILIVLLLQNIGHCQVTIPPDDVLPTGLTDKIKRLYAVNSPFAKFFWWQLNADPSWSKPIEACWYTYVGGGENQYKQLMLDPAKWVLDKNNLSTHNDHGWPITYAMIRPYLDEATKQSHEADLKALAEYALTVRLDDSDETTFAACIVSSVDRLCGTSYRSRSEFSAIMVAVNSFIERALDGIWIESYPDYDLNTFQWVCYLYTLEGPNAMPKFPALLKSAAKYIVWSISPDGFGTEFHGDNQDDNNNPMWGYRLSNAMVISSLLPQDDEDNIHLKDFIREKILITAQPSDLYSLQLTYSLYFSMLYFDPDTLPTQTTYYRPTGMLVARGRGNVIYRDIHNFITVDMRNPTGVDHDEAGGFGNVRWLTWSDAAEQATPGFGWIWALDCPGGYAATPITYNSPVIAGNDIEFSVWNFPRGLVSATQTANGMQVIGQMHGPWNQPGNGTWTFLDKMQETVSFNGTYLTIKYEWIGTNTKRLDTTRPFFESHIFLGNHTTAHSGDGSVSYTVPGNNVPIMVTFSGQDKYSTSVLTDPIQRVWSKVIPSSDKITGVLTVNIGPNGVPKPDVGVLTLTATENYPPSTLPPPPTPDDPTAKLTKLDPTLFSTNTHSISGWFNANKQQSGVIFCQIANGGVSAGYCPALCLTSDGKIQSSMFWHGSVNSRISSTNTYNDSNWHHFAITNDGITENLYLDGVSVGTQNGKDVSYAQDYIYCVGGGFDAGWPLGVGWNNFTGQLDKVTGYNRVLSSDEVKTQYTAGRSDNSPIVTIGPWTVNGWTFEVQKDGSLKLSGTIPLSK